MLTVCWKCRSFVWFINTLFPRFTTCFFFLLWYVLIYSLQTQRDGLIFIYDMTNSSYSNFDYELCVKILNLLKVSI